ncbi:DUF4352 domain-containing protein [Dactylosporangium sp. CS-033363]|uniref:DUF4352 domain-containing protein n=1 Tax=Dactylosporangium sp. CS-033363 TaxID=3239935 RepID=UPI003D8BF81C
MRTKLIVGTLAVTAAFIIACGSTGTSSSSSGAGAGGNAGSSGGAVAQQADEKKGPATVKVGEPLTLKESILGDTTVVEITLSELKANVKATDGFSKPKQGQFVTVKVSLQVKQGKYSINSTAFKFVTADNTAIDSTLSLDGKDLMANDIASGQKASGTVWFDVPKGAEKGGKIALKSILADGDAGYFAL